MMVIGLIKTHYFYWKIIISLNLSKMVEEELSGPLLGGGGGRPCSNSPRNFIKFYHYNLSNEGDEYGDIYTPFL